MHALGFDSHSWHRSWPPPHRLGVDRERRQPARSVACGSLATSERAALSERLLAIHDGLIAVIERYAPQEAAVEQTFVNANAVATLKLGQARGIAMLVPARAGLTVAEYAPNLVKKTVIGAGHGDKAQIRMMIGVLLPKMTPESRRRRRRAGDCNLPRASSRERGDEDGGGMSDVALVIPGRAGGANPKSRTDAVLASGFRVRRSAPSRNDRTKIMIGKLKGIIDSYGEDSIILDVNGVGYLVHCSARTLQALPASGEAATLSIETYVREDQIKLFGFASDSEREWFRLLQTVQGVGAKVALAVLGTLKPSELASAIAMRDKAMVARTPGVGPKVAERIVTELKDRAPALADIDPAVVHLAGSLDEKRAPKPVADAVSALINLGYGQPQAAAAIAAASRAAGEGADTATLIRQGLKELAR